MIQTGSSTEEERHSPDILPLEGRQIGEGLSKGSVSQGSAPFALMVQPHHQDDQHNCAMFAQKGTYDQVSVHRISAYINDCGLNPTANPNITCRIMAEEIV